jgi:hypothetical protein
MKGKIVIIFLITAVILPIYGINEIPNWIRDNAVEWLENKIDDQTFLLGIEYLVKENIIKVNLDIEYKTEDRIPNWIRDNVKWWLENKIDDQTFLLGIEYLVKENIIVMNSNVKNEIDIEEPKKIVFSTEPNAIFKVWSFEDDLIIKNGKIIFSKDFHFDFIKEFNELHDEISIINNNFNAIVILPVFTSSAYVEKGFYDYYKNECETCTTTKIVENDYLESSAASHLGAKVLEKLGYNTITDIVVDKNPEILKNYDTVILLHNEYVTKKEFNAIINHPNVIYLYPNALYAEISVDYEKNEITLVRGHGYPELEIGNGFNWEFENTHPYEYDTDCLNWEFYDIPNGKMLNCYPDVKMVSDTKLLKQIKNLLE